MATTKPRLLMHIQYEKAAEAYLRSLPLEHFMEATAQGTQRRITLESLDLLHARRPDVQLFNELLVQYPVKGGKIGQVVPDNMVVVHTEPIRASGSYDLPLQPVGPFWVLEYISKHNERKDYEESFQKYERDIKVPFLLLFHPEIQELTLYRHNGRKYVSVKANRAGRFAVAELDVEVAILDGWVRFWHEGELLPLPGDLQRELNEARAKLKEARAESEQARADSEQARATALEAQARADRETRQKNRLLEQLRKLGIEPDLGNGNGRKTQS